MALTTSSNRIFGLTLYFSELYTNEELERLSVELKEVLLNHFGSTETQAVESLRLVDIGVSDELKTPRPLKQRGLKDVN